MADEEPESGGTGWPLSRRLAFALFAALVALGAVFYLWWGFSFGVWVDNGDYAVVITLTMFGLAGMWLVSPERPVPSPAAPKS